MKKLILDKYKSVQFQGLVGSQRVISVLMLNKFTLAHGYEVLILHYLNNKDVPHSFSKMPFAS